MKKIKKDDIKKGIKYTVNIINFLNAVLLVLIPIWNIPYGNEISKTLIGISGVISTYLLSNNYYENKSIGR